MRIFVFGSNLAGRHGKGSALEAKKNWGAIYGQGYGFQGRSYAIPTKDQYLRTLPISDIEEYVLDFIQFAKNNPDMIFDVVKIGCGLAGYSEDEIYPMFRTSPENVNLPKNW